MDDNNLDNQNPTENTEQDNVSMLDKVIQNNPFVKLGQANYQNVQTQSVVKSTREEANEQLASIQARNEAIARQQKLAEDAAKAKRTAIYVIIGIFFASILGVGIWLAVNAIIASQKPVVTGNGGSAAQKTQKGTVEGYKCSSETKCEKVAEISAKMILVRDGSRYYTYDTEKDKSTLTIIPEEDYHAITPFVWGEKNYLVIDPESDRSALFSISDNKIITEFAYDQFFTDIKADIYKDMTSEYGKYIIAKSSGLYRLIDVFNGKEKAHAGKRVYVNGKYYFGYENDGTIHIYNDEATQIKVAPAGSNVYTYKTYVIVVDANNAYYIYEQSGMPTSDTATIQLLNSLGDPQKIVSLLNARKDFYHIPVNQ